MRLSDRYAQVRLEVGTGEEGSADGTRAGRALWDRSRARRALQTWTMAFPPGTPLPEPSRTRRTMPNIVIWGHAPGPPMGGATARSTILPNRTERVVVLR